MSWERIEHVKPLRLSSERLFTKLEPERKLSRTLTKLLLSLEREEFRLIVSPLRGHGKFENTSDFL